jgi:hypothetical protein
LLGDQFRAGSFVPRRAALHKSRLAASDFVLVPVKPWKSRIR